mmetsp:Transcript_20070/g.76870  ORF Transcript_20070/g.76870 Transcript_20070/m.76870 type:complete len:231 (+) Transcript_20070:482-1174(+)
MRALVHVVFAQRRQTVEEVADGFVTSEVRVLEREADPDVSQDISRHDHPLEVDHVLLLVLVEVVALHREREVSQEDGMERDGGVVVGELSVGLVAPSGVEGHGQLLEGEEVLVGEVLRKLLQALHRNAVDATQDLHGCAVVPKLHKCQRGREEVSDNLGLHLWRLVAEDLRGDDAGEAIEAGRGTEHVWSVVRVLLPLQVHDLRQANAVVVVRLHQRKLLGQHLRMDIQD